MSWSSAAATPSESTPSPILSRREWTLLPVWDSTDWGSPYKNKITLCPALPEFLRKFKRGYFIEWRIADRHKAGLYRDIDGVPEENSLYLKCGDMVIETLAMNLVLYAPPGLLGESVYARFGAEYPIRMDFLDTIGGQNLSLQVHPLTDYIHSQFGMAYTQDESYYILDADENACVCLGLREGIDRDEMLADLRRAQSSGSFDAEKCIRWDRTTDWVMSNLVDKTELLTSNASFTKERTGLHSLEFIESRRYMTSSTMPKPSSAVTEAVGYDYSGIDFEGRTFSILN